MRASRCNQRSGHATGHPADRGMLVRRFKGEVGSAVERHLARRAPRLVRLGLDHALSAAPPTGSPAAAARRPVRQLQQPADRFASCSSPAPLPRCLGSESAHGYQGTRPGAAEQHDVRRIQVSPKWRTSPSPAPSRRNAMGDREGPPARCAHPVPPSRRGSPIQVESIWPASLPSSAPPRNASPAARAVLACCLADTMLADSGRLDLAIIACPSSCRAPCAVARRGPPRGLLSPPSRVASSGTMFADSSRVDLADIACSSSCRRAVTRRGLHLARCLGLPRATSSSTMFAHSSRVDLADIAFPLSARVSPPRGGSPPPP
jgi:hypothetical protein